jgi:hypothetical protein
MGRRRIKQVEIFNFSFLDILACTIGLLIFIMVMVFILQSEGPVADTGAIISKKLGEASQLQESAARDAQIAQGLESQFDGLRTPDQPDLSPQRDAARTARDAARVRYDSLEKQLAAAQGRIDEARLARDRSIAGSLQRAKDDLAVAQEHYQNAEATLAALIANAKTKHVVQLQQRRNSGDKFRVLHVDCHANKVELYRELDGVLVSLGQTAADNLQDQSSAYQTSVASYRQLENGLILFWVRPDGTETFETAMDAMPKPTTSGFEPADADWSFQTTADAKGNHP